MRILFIYTDIGIDVGYSCGIGALSAFLKRHGHRVSLLHVNEQLGYGFDMGRIVADVKKLAPGLVCFSCTTNQWVYVRAIANAIRSASTVPICVGGPHANAAPLEIVQDHAVDFVCKGEGELPLLELVNRLQAGLPPLVDNMLTKLRRAHCEQPEASAEANGDQIIDNPVGRWIDHLDSLPFEDREIFDFDRIVAHRHGWAEVITSRGCPYRCSYCFNESLWNRYYRDLQNTSSSVTPRDYIRRRSPERTIGMLEEVRDRYANVEYFTFVDDVFAIDAKWLSVFASYYRDSITMPFSATTQPLAFTERIAVLLHDMGCKVVKMGVEAGNPVIRRRVLSRSISDQVLASCFALARKYRLKPQAFNMIGIPTETVDDMLLTARLNARLRPYIVHLSVCTPYPGTSLYRYSIENDLLQPARWDSVTNFRTGSVLAETTFTYAQLERVRVMFRWYLNAYLQNECSAEFAANAAELAALPDDRWLSGEAETVWQDRDSELDKKYTSLQLDHYIGRKQNHMFWAKEYDFDLT